MDAGRKCVQLSTYIEFFRCGSPIFLSEGGEDILCFLSGQRKDAICNKVFLYHKDAPPYFSKLAQFFATRYLYINVGIMMDQ